MHGAPDQYGVIGHPVSHSWSPFIHGLFARQTGQAMSYRLLDVPPGQLRSRLLEFFTSGGRGLNVTVPHKAAAAEFANELTPRAEQAGAANTLALQEGERVLGDNTDGVGLVRDLRHNLGLELAGRRLLVLGAGGATRGVLGPLLAQQPAEIVIANRTVGRAHELARRFEALGPVRGCGIDAIADPPFDLVINATSASLQGAALAIAPAVLGRDTVCYDMAYGKAPTPFEQWAQAQGCTRTHRGWGMLVEQAAESFALWRGIRPDTAAVLAALQSSAAPRR